MPEGGPLSDPLEGQLWSFHRFFQFTWDFILATGSPLCKGTRTFPGQGRPARRSRTSGPRAEELHLEEGQGDRGRVDHLEGAGGPAALRVDYPRHDLLAGPGFFLDQDREVAASEPVEDGEEVLHRPRLRDETGPGIIAAREGRRRLPQLAGHAARELSGTDLGEDVPRPRRNIAVIPLEECQELDEGPENRGEVVPGDPAGPGQARWPYQHPPGDRGLVAPASALKPGVAQGSWRDASRIGDRKPSGQRSRSRYSRAADVSEDGRAEARWGKCPLGRAVGRGLFR